MQPQTTGAVAVSAASSGSGCSGTAGRRRLVLSPRACARSPAPRSIFAMGSACGGALHNVAAGHRPHTPTLRARPRSERPPAPRTAPSRAPTRPLRNAQSTTRAPRRVHDQTETVWVWGERSWRKRRGLAAVAGRFRGGSAALRALFVRARGGGGGRVLNNWRGGCPLSTPSRDARDYPRQGRVARRCRTMSRCHRRRHHRTDSFGSDALTLLYTGLRPLAVNLMLNEELPDI